MAGQPLVVLAVVQQLFGRHVAVEYTTAGIASPRGAQPRQKRPARIGAPPAINPRTIATLRHRVVRPPGVPAQSLCAGQRSEEHDRVPAQLNVEFKIGFLLVGELVLLDVQFDGLELGQIDREFLGLFGGHGARTIEKVADIGKRESGVRWQTLESVERGCRTGGGLDRRSCRRCGRPGQTAEDVVAAVSSSPISAAIFRRVRQ